MKRNRISGRWGDASPTITYSDEKTIEIYGVQPAECDFCRRVLLPLDTTRWYLCERHYKAVKKEIAAIEQQKELN